MGCLTNSANTGSCVISSIQVCLTLASAEAWAHRKCGWVKVMEKKAPSGASTLQRRMSLLVIHNDGLLTIRAGNAHRDSSKHSQHTDLPSLEAHGTAARRILEALH